MQKKIKSNLNFHWGYFNSKYGKHSLFTDDKQFVKDLCNYDLPDNHGLKIFKNEKWQESNLREVTIIQNIFYFNKLAPRVRDLIEIETNERKYFAQIVEKRKKFIDDIDSFSLEKLKQFNKIIKTNFDNVSKNNYINQYSGLHNELLTNIGNLRKNENHIEMIDFGGYSFKDQKRYKKDLINKIIEVTHYGKRYKGGKASYQSIDDWGLDGKRKMTYRIKQMQIDKQNFKNKSVLDLGCNLGLMLHYAYDKGAKKMVGYDFDNLIKVAKEYANFREKFNIDFYAKDLSKGLPNEKYDIVFYLAMSEYLGYPKKLAEITKEVLYYEGHASNDMNEAKTELSKLFKVVIPLGHTNDRSERPILICKHK